MLRVNEGFALSLHRAALLADV